MSKIDKRALRESAERAGQNDWEYVYTSDLSAPGRGYITVGGAEAIYCLNKAAGGVKQSENVLRYIAAASPETMLALLNEIAELEQRHCGTALLEREEMHTKTLGRMLDELEAKDKSIGFLKDQLAQLANFNPDWDKLEAATYSLREHMAELTAARKRIAELEAREVLLPQRYSMLHRVDFDEPYHTEMVYKQHQVLEALHDAGVNVAAAGKGEAS
ncbi:ead/Ea22-like family protein [Enterobacter hormaechei]|uniref:ead/Ea22-like family protein n=1 Tax=Enterobacter hormaechei TaxID=158836 RepID=UPI00294A9871|nr:ead/Ea22-like family protein [Enterobacter hormaechei]MDV5435558.1 ead/Ea22-like family protein [Enterobacter hormaechei]